MDGIPTPIYDNPLCDSFANGTQYGNVDAAAGLLKTVSPSWVNGTTAPFVTNKYVRGLTDVQPFTKHNYSMEVNSTATTITDETGAISLTVEGAPTITQVAANVKYGSQALQSLTSGNNIGYNFNGSGTYFPATGSLWFWYKNYNNVNETSKRIYNIYNPGTPALGLQIGFDASGYLALTYDTGVNVPYRNVSYTSFNDKYRLIGVVWNGTARYMYVDGVLVGGTATTSQPQASDANEAQFYFSNAHGIGGVVGYIDDYFVTNSTAVISDTRPIAQSINVTLPSITGTLTGTSLFTISPERESGDNITYTLVYPTHTETSWSSSTFTNFFRNTNANTSEVPTRMLINLVGKTNPTADYPSLRSYCLVLWKS